MFTLASDPLKKCLSEPRALFSVSRSSSVNGISLPSNHSRQGDHQSSLAHSALAAHREDNSLTFLFGVHRGSPFRSVEEMDQTILDRINAFVKANDILYFLGDFCIGSKAKALEHRKQIRCKKIFAVPGNHDKQIRKLTEEFSWLSNLAGTSTKSTC
jgi:hypothetical protein